VGKHRSRAKRDLSTQAELDGLPDAKRRRRIFDEVVKTKERELDALWETLIPCTHFASWDKADALFSEPGFSQDGARSLRNRLLAMTLLGLIDLPPPGALASECEFNGSRRAH
jgi:hypothetical protein